MKAQEQNSTILNQLEGEENDLMEKLKLSQHLEQELNRKYQDLKILPMPEIESKYGITYKSF